MMLTVRSFAGFVTVLSAAVLGTALLSQFWGGLAPCELCLLQRLPWDAALAAALIALVAGDRVPLAGVATALGLAFFVSVVFAFYHVGVEQHWFAGPSACTASNGGAQTIEEMKRQILGTAPVLCDQVQWSFFGVSLAGFNLIASLAMLGFCVFTFLKTRRPTLNPTAQRLPGNAA
jgi:disulfide bond formation protein DsbB